MVSVAAGVAPKTFEATYSILSSFSISANYNRVAVSIEETVSQLKVFLKKFSVKISFKSLIGQTYTSYSLEVFFDKEVGSEKLSDEKVLPDTSSELVISGFEFTLKAEPSAERGSKHDFPRLAKIVLYLNDTVSHNEPVSSRIVVSPFEEEGPYPIFLTGSPNTDYTYDPAFQTNVTVPDQLPGSKFDWKVSFERGSPEDVNTVKLTVRFVRNSTTVYEKSVTITSSSPSEFFFSSGSEEPNYENSPTIGSGEYVFQIAVQYNLPEGKPVKITLDSLMYVEPP